MTSEKDPAAWIIDAARGRPQSMFLRAAGRELSYAALVEQTGRIAAALRLRGVVPGDRVAVQVEKSVDAVLLYVACLRMGAVFVPINVANTASEVDFFLHDSQPRVAVVRPRDLELLEPRAAQAGVLHLETLGVDGAGSLPDLVRQCAGVTAAEAAVGAGGPHTLAAIVYTSGTTGRSKGAMLTRGNLASNAAVLADVWRFTADDVLLHALPLFHVHGLFAALNTVLASGSSLVLLPKFDAVTVVSGLKHATVYMGVPTHYTRLLKEPALDRAATCTVRLFVSGSAPLAAETHREFSMRTGHEILERYGMTETLMIASNPYDGARVPGSVGRVLPGVSLRVAHTAADVGEAAAVGALEVKGPNVFAGYWADPEKTRSEFTSDGWFKTGDLGRIDPDGYVVIVGRAKDLVISGGYNVYPKEVETELDLVPGVLESAVFGVPHPDFGEGVTAAVVRESGSAVSEAEIIDAVKARLAGYKIPKRILVMDELPRNAMGKVLKNVLRSGHETLYRDAALGGHRPLKLISSMATRAVLAEMTDRFRRDTAQTVTLEAAGGVDAAKRVRSGEAVDVVILASGAIDALMAAGKLLPGRVDLVKSGIAVAVRAGASLPAIDTEAAVKKAVLEAPSLSYSTGPSGVYLEGLFARWGILAQLRPRIVVPPPGVPVASLVAGGSAALGFQQLSELLNVAGVAVVGPLPPPIQSVTIFSGGVSTACKDPAAARALLDFLASPAVSVIKRRHGLEAA